MAGHILKTMSAQLILEYIEPERIIIAIQYSEKVYFQTSLKQRYKQMTDETLFNNLSRFENFL